MPEAIQKQLLVIHDLITNGRTKSAESLLKAIVQNHPTERAVIFEQGRLFLFGKKQYAEAESIFGNLLGENPSDVNSKLHLFLAQRELRKLDEAKALIESLLQSETGPLRGVIQSLYAHYMCWAELPNFPKYLPEVESAFQADSSNPFIAEVLAYFLMQTHSPKAVSFVESWMQSHPDDHRMLYQLALLRKKEGRLNETGKLLQELITQNPDNEEYIKLYQENQTILGFWKDNAHLYPPYVMKAVIKD